MNNKGLIYYKIFRGFEDVVAFTSTKQTFETKNPRFTGDSTDIFEQNRILLAEKLMIKPDQLVFPRQTHTNCVVEVSEIPENEIKETDALVTNKSGICLCVQTADCVPILLFDPVENVIAAVHAGWRGTVKKIAENTVQGMKQNYGSLPENIIAAIGPSISPEIYEVGNEVVEEVLRSIPNAEISLHKNSSDKFHLNLWEANRQVLLQNGLQTKNIEILGECSFSESEKYYSARKEGVETGRMVSGIMLMK
ncbi:MAG TPA: peptidoglycan editing factor PgeF [Draconibacterium sp.]|nr:peptidoglycan editing factor PgeF [Draconibacterium sp.]